MLNHFKQTHTLTFLCTLFLTIISFFFFSPLYNPEYNSDQAIHVLMSARFDWQYSSYYWGQNRLGSFFPLVCSILLKVFPIAPLILCAIVNQLMLLTTILISQSFLKNNFSKILIAAVLLFPFYTYRAILLIGHPYATQLFLISISIFILSKVHAKILKGVYTLNILETIKIQIAVVLFFLSVWVSETSAINAFYIICFLIVYRNEYFKFINGNRSKIIFLLSVSFFILICCSGIAFYFYSKSLAPIDQLYDHFFITDASQISVQFSNLQNEFISVFDFNNFDFLIFSFYFLIVSLVLYQLFDFFKRVLNKQTLNYPLLILNLTNMLFAVILFFAHWNFLFQFDPKYYILNYYLFFLATLIFFENKKPDGRIVFNFYLIIMFSILLGGNYKLINNLQSAFQIKKNAAVKIVKYIKNGAVMSDNYWVVYLVNSYSPNDIIGIPLPEKGIVRNEHERYTFLQMNNFYYLTDTPPEVESVKDTLREFQSSFVRIKGLEVFYFPYYVYKYQLIK